MTRRKAARKHRVLECKCASLYGLIFVFPFLLFTNMRLQAVENVGPANALNAIAEPRSKTTYTWLFRNDSYLSIPHEALSSESTWQYVNLSESRLRIRHLGDRWTYYADGRLYMNYSGSSGETETEARLIRSFLQLNSVYGDFRIGKSYVNLGVPEVFNPFELEKTIQYNDLTYDKEGLLAFDYNFSWSETGLIRFFGASPYKSDNYDQGVTSTQNNENDSSANSGKEMLGGLQLQSNFWMNDFALLVYHAAYNENIAGFFIRGDAVLGILLSYAFHFDDDAKKSFSEIQAGLDYSFWDGKIIPKIIVYYNEDGKSNQEYYGLEKYFSNSYLLARWYSYSSLQYVHDEFFSLQAGVFNNWTDGSSLLHISLLQVIRNGINFTLQYFIATGKGADEFSRSVYANGFLNFRLDVKF